MSAFHSTFVSHAHADNNLCDQYVAALRTRGINVWYDRDNMQVGHSLSADIEAELRKRTALVVIATPASLASQWVSSEIAAFRSLAAHDPARLFVPVRAISCEMPLLWADILWIDALAMPFEETIATITNNLVVRTAPATLAPPETPSRRPVSPLPARSLLPRAPEATPPRPTRPSDVRDILGKIPLAAMQSLYDGYMTFYVYQLTQELDNMMAELRAELRENDAKEASFRPSRAELSAIERLQRSGVTGMDLLDRMMEQGEDWLIVTMRRLDHFERTGQAPNDYSTWCEHALSGAYDWMNPERGGDALGTNGPSPTSNAPDWLRNRQSTAQQGPDDNDNDNKGHNIFRIFSN